MYLLQANKYLSPIGKTIFFWVKSTMVELSALERH